MNDNTPNPVLLPHIGNIDHTTHPQQNTQTITIHISNRSRIEYHDNGNTITRTTYKYDTPDTPLDEEIVQESTRTTFDDITQLETVANNFLRQFDDITGTLGDIEHKYPDEVIDALTPRFANADDNVYKVNRELDTKVRDQHPEYGHMSSVLDSNKDVKHSYRFPIGTQLYNNTPSGIIVEVVGYDYSGDTNVVEKYMMEPIDDNETLYRTYFDAKTVHRGFVNKSTKLVRYGSDD